MSNPGKKYFPHLALHFLTVMIALTALALAMINYREIKMLRERLRAAAATESPVSAVTHEKNTGASMNRPEPKKSQDAGKEKKRAIKRQAGLAHTEKVKEPVSEETTTDIRDRGLNEIISDLVDSVFE